MHIGIDASRVSIAERTGTENYAYQVINALARIDKDNQYILYFREKLSKDFFQQLSARNDRFEYKVISWPRVWTQAGLALELIRSPVDVMFIPAHTMPIVRRPNQKFVVTIHGLEYMFMPEYERFPQKLYLTKSTEFVSRFADHIIAVSEFTKQSLLDHGWGATSDRITIVPEGVRMDHFYSRTPDEISLVLDTYNVQAPYLFFISTIQPRKNVPALLRAFAKIRSEVERFGRHTLVLAGKEGWKFEEIPELIEKLNIQDSVKYIGRVPDEDVPALISGARALVYPSLIEGFGLPVLEAMACGTPVVASAAGAIPEVGGSAVLYVDPKNVDSIAEGLFAIVSDENLHVHLQKAGLDHVKQFTWERTAEGVIEVFEQVIKK